MMNLEDIPSYIDRMPVDLGQFYSGGRLIPTSLAREIIRNIVARTIASEVQNHLCAYCCIRTELDGPRAKRPTLEHIVPRCRLGKRWHPCNHLMVCYACNKARGEQYLAIEELIPTDARVRKRPDRDRFFKRRKKPKLQWQDHVLIDLETGEAVASFYKIISDSRTLYHVRVVDAGIGVNGQTETDSREQAISLVSTYGAKWMRRRTTLRSEYQKTLAVAFSNADTNLKTSAA